MDYIRRITSRRADPAALRAAACRARARRARAWARVVFWAAAATFLSAVWQDRALAPPLHDGMRAFADHLRTALDEPVEFLRNVRPMSWRPGMVSVGPEFDPVTAWLLKWRD